MNFALKLSIRIFLTGVAILFILLVVVYNINYSNVLQSEMQQNKSIVDEVSFSIDKNILEKVKTVKTIARTPSLISALKKSNIHYGSLQEQIRTKEIQSHNEKWKSINDHENPFILQYTNNLLSQYLKDIQNSLEGEYGEIFITNKFGALVASTSKLTTFAHGHKYWWKGAYNNGNGALFFDDRGYDVSVGNYVFGLVIPVKNGNEIIGILKVNLNLLGSISKILKSSKNSSLEKLKLIRSGGLIIIEEGSEPLSKRVQANILEKVNSNNGGSFILEKEGEDYIFSTNKLNITANRDGSYFGGSFESIDHKKGNRGESWYIIGCRPLATIAIIVADTIKKLLLIGSILSVVLALTALFIGGQAAKPIKELMQQANLVAEGDFDSRVSFVRKDEIGLLATAFNKMARNLKETTTSIDNLNAEVLERKKTEQTLIESEERFRTVFEQVAVGIIRADMNTGEFLSVNQKFLDIIGYTQDELFKLTFKDISYPEDLDEDLKNLSLLQASKISFFTVDKRYIRKDGVLIWVKITVSPIVQHTGSQKHLIVVVEDISDRKKAENSLRLYMQQLQERNEDLDAFSHTVAHDLKNPLAAILGFADLLFDSYSTISREDAMIYLSRIIKGGQKTEQIINSLLLFANIRKSDVPTEELNMGNIVEETIERLNELSKNIKAKIIFPDTFPAALGYAPWVEEVWVNFLSNAIKYAGNSPQIEIGYNTSNSYNTPKGMLRFWVKDKGPGISNNNQKLLFNKFERLDQIKTEGHGLGLSIVRRITEKLGGQVGVESKFGEGCLFYFTLPKT